MLKSAALRRRVAVVLAVVVMSVLFGAGNAGAAGNFQFPDRFAGYRLTTTNSNMEVKVEYRIPTFTCPPSTPQLAIPGAAIFAGRPSQGSGGGMVLMCDAVGDPLLFADLYAPGIIEQVWAAPKSGDLIAVDVWTSTSYSNATVSDLTANWSYKVTGKSDGSDLSADVGLFAQGCTKGACYSVPAFGTIVFRTISVNGVGLTGGSRHTIVDSQGNVEARAGRLVASGTQFAARWVSSCVPPAGTDRC